MSNNEQSTIEQLQALASEILKGLAETKQVTNSNARAIEALANNVAEDRKETQKSQRRLYESMAKMSDALAQMSSALGQVGAAQSSLWEVQADYYRRLEEMDERQARMIEILDRLTQKDSNS